MKNNKRLNYISGIIVILGIFFFANSCDDSFMETQTPEYAELYDTLFVTNTSEPFSLDLDFGTNEACNWRLAQYPFWLEISPKEGRKEANGTATIQFTVIDGNISVEPGFYTFPLAFDINNKQIVNYTALLAHLGHPHIQVSRNSLAFTNTFNQSLEIRNNSYGILNWWIASAPEWLVANKEGGLIDENQSENIQLTAKINGLDPGDYSGILRIQSNAENTPSFDIQVSLKVGASAYYGNYHQGVLVDTRFNKSRDEVIVLTKSPNQLLFFKSTIDQPETIDLERVPNCLAISEDQSTFAIGYSNSELTTYDASTHTPIKTVNLATIPLSIEFGNNQWVYFIATQGYDNYLYSINLDSEEIYRSKQGKGSMETLKKVPGKPTLVTTRPGYSPDGLLLYDISEMGQTDSLNQYHMDMERFWLSEDGEQFFTAWKKIYNIPDYVEGDSFFPDEPRAIGQLDFENWPTVECLADQTSSNRIFAAVGFHGSDAQLSLKVYNSNTLAQQKSYDLQFSRPEFFSAYNTWSGRPVALFPSKNEEDVWLVQKFAEYSYNGSGIWSVTKVDITK